MTKKFLAITALSLCVTSEAFAGMPVDPDTVLGRQVHCARPLPEPSAFPRRAVELSCEQ